MLVRERRRDASPRRGRGVQPRAQGTPPPFIVDDLPALAARLEQAGHRLAGDVPIEGYDRRFVDDPFGNRIELMQPR